MAFFSWSDIARAAFGSCLPCLPSSRPRHTDDREHFARRDELESLLQSAEFTDTDMDVDALSLHSNIGRQDGRKRVKKKRTKNKGSITLFGYDLFGRPLPDGGDADEGDNPEAHRRVSRISSSTLDSDAAPLADDTIAELSTQTRSQREVDLERKAARKRMRKQQKAAALLDARADEFEGFPGSGALAPAADDFGAFQQAPRVPDEAEREFTRVGGRGADEANDDADADFDAGSYVRTAATRSDSGSGTRSRTSASNTQAQSVPVPLLPSSPGPAGKPKRAKKSGKRSATTASSATNSQPRSPTSAVPVPHVDIANPTEGSPFDDQPRPVKGGLRLTGESVHGDQERAFPSPGLSSSRGFPSPGLSGGFPSPGLGRSGGFPSPGLGGRKNSLSMSGQGAFLARTGEDP